jgi:hypothetical protein
VIPPSLSTSVADDLFSPKHFRKLELFRSPKIAIVCAVRNNINQMRFHGLHFRPRRSKVLFMTRHRTSNSQSSIFRCGLMILLLMVAAPRPIAADPPPAAVSAFNAYIGRLEARLAQQHRSPNTFIAPVASGAEGEGRLRRGELIIENVPPSGASDLPGAILFHRRGTAFASGAKAADFERLVKDFNAYPQRYAPQVLQSKILAGQGDRFQATMRVRQVHIITVVMDMAYDIAFGHLDAQHGYTIAHSTNISEIDAPGTRNERALGPDEAHGFLWRLNTYWSYEERDGGLYMQIETVSLTRSIPRGLAWAVEPFVESVPRESLEFTLRATRNALRK